MALVHPIERAIVFGAGGGIGSALVDALLGQGCACVHAGYRMPPPSSDPRIRPFAFALDDEASIAAGAAASTADGAPDLVIIATGVLHGADWGPEKSLRGIEPARMAHMLAVNTIGPALIAKHMLPHLPRERRSVFAALSARVGSISDNRLGGWHSYRASKAALNMLLRNFAIEMAARHPHAIIAGLHPGTVDSALSAPFQRGVPEGKLFTPAYSAAQLLSVLDRLTPTDSGGVFAWDGERIPA